MSRDSGVTGSVFGQLEDRPVREFRLLSRSGAECRVMELGAAMISLRMPVGGGVREVLLGCDDLESYRRQEAYLGAIVGRYANRIAGARFKLDGSIFHLQANQGGHCLHGGPVGVSYRLWSGSPVEHEGCPAVRFVIDSGDGDQGFPGNMSLAVTYFWSADDTLSVDMTATTDRPCPVSLTTHGYFNLAGAASDCREHELCIRADRYLPVDGDGIPRQALQPVAGTVFDFRSSRRVGQGWGDHPDQRLVKGFDHSFLLNEREASDWAARVVAPDGRLAMELYTDQPAVQFYTGNYLQDVPGRQGRAYRDYDALCLEPQALPDTPNRPDFGDATLRPGSTYRHRTDLRFVAG